MSTSSPHHVSPATPGSALSAGLQLVPHAFALSALMCGLFTFAASAFVAVALPWAGIEEEPGFYARLAAKATAFGLVTLLAGSLLRRLMRSFPPRLPAIPLSPDEGSGRFLLLLVLLVFVLLAFPRLSGFPWTAPDELHHLIVVRNLAEYGVYASGHPDHELVEYDSYDSVGPAVIVPAAAAYRLHPERVVAPRLTIACMFIAWLAATWLLLRPVIGGRAAAVSILLAGTAIGSVYLGRTLYGEVPALLYATAGLLYWRMALGRIRHLPWSLMAGICFGLAVLSKTFFVLAVFPVIAACIFDRLSFRRVRLTCVVWPAAAAAVTIASWMLYQIVDGGGSGSAAETVHLYRHYLLFGFTSVDVTLSWFLQHWTSVIVLVLGYISVIPLLLLARYDVPTLVLALIGVLFAYWWTFFTPGQIPRYLWYTLAVGGALAGPILFQTVAFAFGGYRHSAARILSAALAALLVVPSILEVAHVSRLMWRGQEMADEYALRDYLLADPEEELVTTSWMAQRSANFFAGRYLPLVDPAATDRQMHYVLRDRALEDVELNRAQPLARGRYLIVPPAAAQKSTQP